DGEDQCPTVQGPRELHGCPPPAGDTDGDGIRDDVDKCINEPEDKDGFEDDDGCPDFDNDKDGVPDELDICPFEAGPADLEGCPAPVVDALPPLPALRDTDGDGIADANDLCPNEPEDMDGFEDQDGCPEPDNDHDGVLDEVDQCPLDAETINGNDDEDG